MKELVPGEEYMMMMSGTGNEEFLEKHFSDPKLKKGLTLGTVMISCWWMKAIKDDSGAVIGSKITYIFSVNPGGSIPKSLTEGQGPSTALNALTGLI